MARRRSSARIRWRARKRQPVVLQHAQDAGGAGAGLRRAGQQGDSILALFQAGEDQDRDQGIGPAVEIEDLAGLGISQ